MRAAGCTSRALLPNEARAPRRLKDVGGWWESTRHGATAPQAGGRLLEHVCPVEAFFIVPRSVAGGFPADELLSRASWRAGSCPPRLLPGGRFPGGRAVVPCLLAAGRLPSVARPTGRASDHQRNYLDTTCVASAALRVDTRAGKTGHGLCRPLERLDDAGTARMALGKPDGHPDLWLHGALAKLSLLEVGPRLPDGEVLELPLVGLVRMPSRAPFSFSFLTQKTSGYIIYL